MSIDQMQLTLFNKEIRVLKTSINTSTIFRQTFALIKLFSFNEYKSFEKKLRTKHIKSRKYQFLKCSYYRYEDFKRK